MSIETITQTYTGVPMRKLRELLASGWVVNGVAITRTEEDGTMQRGAVTTGGMVLWWNREPALVHPVEFDAWFDAEYEAANGFVSSGDPTFYDAMLSKKEWALRAWNKATPPAKPEPVQEPASRLEIDQSRVMGLADLHSMECLEDGTHIIDLGGFIAFAADVLRIAVDAQSKEPAQPAPDLSKLKPENQQKMREWIADGSFARRAIDTMFELSQEITALKKAQPAPVPKGYKQSPEHSEVFTKAQLLQYGADCMKAAQPAPLPTLVTEEMHVAAVKVLHRANGVDGLPQRMMDAMLAVQPAQPAPVQEPPPWWPAVEKILEEYGLQAVNFVADFNDAMKDASQPMQDQPAPTVQEPVAQAWDEGYRAGVNDERMSEANIGIAGFDAKVEPARNNQYRTTLPAQPAPVQVPLFWYRPCPGGMYEGPVHNNSVGGKMLRDEKPDDWKPLFISPPAQPAAPLTDEDLERCRQWFGAVQDANKQYLTAQDCVLAEKLYLHAGMRVPDGIKQAAHGIKDQP